MHSPFYCSLTHFIQTSGTILLIVEIHIHTFLPLLIPLETGQCYLCVWMVLP